MLYLILHKVRGEPVFDVATFLTDVDIWIIPTSGHRCYPYAYLPLCDLEVTGLDRGFFDPHTWQLPEDLPDHYQAAAEPRPKAAAPPTQTTIEDLLI